MLGEEWTVEEQPKSRAGMKVGCAPKHPRGAGSAGPWRSQGWVVEDGAGSLSRCRDSRRHWPRTPVSGVDAQQRTCQLVSEYVSPRELADEHDGSLVLKHGVTLLSFFPSVHRVCPSLFPALSFKTLHCHDHRIGSSTALFLFLY